MLPAPGLHSYLVPTLVLTHKFIVAKRRKQIAVGVSPRIVFTTKRLSHEGAEAVQDLRPPLRGSIHVNIP